jgi:hypothetical protein
MGDLNQTWQCSVLIWLRWILFSKAIHSMGGMVDVDLGRAKRY